jgi:signal transduction histidine kinase
MGRPPASREDYAITHPLRPLVRASALTLVLFTLVCGLIYAGLRDSPAARVPAVMAYIGLFVVFWIVATAIMAARRPSAQERVVLWRWVATAIILGSHLACLGVIWFVLPRASTTAQLMISLFIVTCIPTQLICSPESVVANRSGVVTVLGSLALFLVTRDSFLERLAAIYVVVFAGAMFVLSNILNQTVQDTVAARLASDAAARQLDRMLGEVAAQRDASTKFIASASHDLGQPLQAVALFFDQTLRAPKGALRDAAIDGVRNALVAADELLSHMLGHLRLEADAVEPHRSSVELPALLKRVAARHAPAVKAGGLTLSVAAHPLVLPLDPSLVDRALGNLIHNAVTHSRGRRILLAARRHGPGAVRIWVVDDGVGVGRIDAKHIFEDYYQGASEQGRARGGFGLGLASVRRLAALMDGVAGLDPRWRRGAAFYLEFPFPGREDLVRSVALERRAS